MCLKPLRHSIFCILPPHVLQSVAENGNDEQRAAAARTLATDATFRALRAAPVEPARQVLAAIGPSQKQRTIHDARNGQTLPGDVVRQEGQGPVADVAVNEAYDGLGDTYDFFADIFDRNSIDDEGMPLDATVHFGNRYSESGTRRRIRPTGSSARACSLDRFPVWRCAR